MSSSPPSPPSAPHQTDELREGRGLRRAGLTLLIFCFTAGLVLRFAELDDDFVWLYFAPPVGIVAGAALLYRGKQLAAAARSRAGKAFGPDTAPVVYLRPFTGDESGWGQIFGALLTAKMFTPVLSDEEQIAEAVSPIGPLVAIGDPGESLPKPGAVRAYPARWRESVEDLLRRSRLVIFRPGTTPGVLWEAQHTFETVSPERVVVLLKRLKSKDYIRIRAEIAEGCGVELPALAAVRRGRRAHALVEFGPGWTPHVLPLKAPYWRGSVRKPMVDVFKYALFPVFQRLGAPWHPSPVSKAKVIAVTCLGLMVTGVALAMVSALVSGSGDDYQFVDDAPLVPAAPADTAIVVAPTPPDFILDAPAEPEPRLVAGVQISAPGELQPSDLELSPDQRANLATTESYVIRDDRFELYVTRFDARHGITVDIVAAAEGVLAAMRRAAGVASMAITTDTCSVSGWPGIRSTVSFVMNGEPWFAEGLTFAVRQSLWSIQASVPRSQDTVVATRAITSVSLPSRLDGVDSRMPLGP